MNINGIEFEVDLLDADVAERYENALEKVKSLEIDKNEKMSVMIKKQCNGVFNFFDEVFGEGAHKKIFGDKVNLMTCMTVFGETIDLMNSQINEFTKEAEKLTNKYSPNRATRRNKK